MSVVLADFVPIPKETSFLQPAPLFEVISVVKPDLLDLSEK